MQIQYSSHPKYKNIFSRYANFRPIDTNRGTLLTNKEIIQHFSFKYLFFMILCIKLHKINWKTVKLDLYSRRNSCYIGKFL